MNRQRFLLYVSEGAIKRDLAYGTSFAKMIAHRAAKIAADQIPPNVQNAAQVFLAYCLGISDHSYKWMLGPKPQRVENKATEGKGNK